MFGKFSKDAQERIFSSRKQLDPEVNLLKLYHGEEAQKKGIIDGVGRVYDIIPQLEENAKIKILTETRLQRLVKDIKRMEFTK